VTRRGVLTSLSPGDMMFLRLGGSALCLLPYLIIVARRIPADLWRRALPLSFAHGWGMVGFTIFGLQIAPAGHGSSLGPGMISVWIALFSYLAFRRAPLPGQRLGLVFILIGGAMILGFSALGQTPPLTLWGDLMFVAASMCGASYLIYAERRQIPAAIGTALVAVTSALVILPWYVFIAPKQILIAPPSQVLLHFVIQGVLMGCVAFMAVGYAVLRIGSLSVGMMLALVPVAGMWSSIEISGDPVTALEWLASLLVTGGVVAGVAAKFKRAPLATAELSGPSRVAISAAVSAPIAATSAAAAA
jgi:drug/metabolite transporter (DMT)-like permease